MRYYWVNTKAANLQIRLYYKLNKFSQTNKNLGRLCSIPVSILDVAIDTLKVPLNAIENFALAAINLIAAAFSKEYSLRDALVLTEFGLLGAVHTPVKLALAPFKIIFQLFAITINPEKVQSIRWER